MVQTSILLKRGKANQEYETEVVQISATYCLIRRKQALNSMVERRFVKRFYCRRKLSKSSLVSQMTAVISNSGNLKIVSGPEDSSDAENKLNTT